jgi:PKD repeat protein
MHHTLAVAAGVTLLAGLSCTEAVTAPGSDAEVVTDLNVEPLGASRMRLTWSAIAGASGYEVERREGLAGNLTKIADVAPANGTVTYVDDDVEPETFYGYRVRTVGRLGATSAASEIAGARSAKAPGVEVTVTMTAPVPAGADPNGFRVRLTGPETVTANVAASASVTVTPLSTGTYAVTLEDVASTCTVVGGPSKSVTVTDQGTETIAKVAFSVVCRDPSKGGVVVVVGAAGDTTDANGVDVRVQGTAGGGASIQEHLATPIGETRTQDPRFLDLTPGSYEVSLLDVNTAICALSSAVNRTVNIASARIDTVRYTMSCSSNKAPQAEAGGPYSGIAGTPIAFTAAGSTDPDGTIAAYAWDFGDGGTASGSAVSHSYAIAGTYKARLTVTDNRGKTGTDSATVNVTAGFAWRNTFSADSVQASEKFRLDVTTRPGPAVHEVSVRIGYNANVIRLDSIRRDSRWDLDFSTDGTLSGTAAIEASRGAAGDSTTPVRVATLFFTGVGANGATSTTSTQSLSLRRSDGSAIPMNGLFVVEDTVRIRGGGNRPPTAKVTGPTTGETGKQLTWVSQPGTADTDGTLTSLVWTYGDGTSSTGSAGAKTYTKPGVYTVKLSVMDNLFATASDSLRVTITQPPNQLPIAEAGGPYQGVTGVSVAFSAAGSIDPDGQIIRYDWQFGDGTAATGSQAFRTYAAAGTYIATLSVVDDRGGVAFDTASVTITQNPLTNIPPKAEANGPYTGTAGQPVAMNALGSSDSDGNIVSYTWYFEDQTTATGQFPLKTFTTPGIYKVTLEVKDNAGAIGTDTTSAIIGGSGQTNLAPIAEANGPYTTRTGVPVAFQSIGSYDLDGFIVSYEWNFGDGSTGSGASPTHTYTTAGTYAVTLVVTDNRGASAVDNTAVVVIQGVPPVAKASGPTTGTTGVPLFFSASQSVDPDGTILSWVWDFGDNSVGLGESVAHAYGNAATYKVRLTVTDNHGLSGRDSLTVVVSGPAVNLPPVAKANGPYSGSVNLPLGFSGAGSVDPDGSIVSYAWNFGDGTTGTGLSTFHQYTTTGTYKAVLTVTDNKGAVDVDTANVTISGGPANTPPRAEANGPYNGSVGVPISFSSAGSVDTDGTIVSFAWLFGDGGSAVGPTVTHAYASAGTYKVRLTVVDNLGATATDSATVTVSGTSTNAKPVAKANGPYSGTVGNAVTFSSAGSADSDGTITSYAWKFGDGGTGSEQNPSHAYTTAGTFVAILTVTDNLGAFDDDTTQVTITSGGGGGGNAKPVANANGPYTGTAGTPVTFSSAGSADSDGTIVAYSWNFGDGTAAGTGASPTHTYAAAGTYQVILTVTDNQNATGLDTAQVTVTGGGGGNTKPIANAGGPYTGDVNVPIQFSSSGSTDPDGTITTYAWTFGDGGTASIANPTHAYTTAGAFSAILTVTDNGGATHADTAQVTVTAVATTNVIKGRWVNSTGAVITSAAAGTNIFLELDIKMLPTANIDAFQGRLDYDPSRLTAFNAGADLNCSGSGAVVTNPGQATCPSGTPSANNEDYLDQYTGNNSVAGELGFQNFSIGPNGTGIQGLAKLRFTAGSAGPATPTLLVLQATSNGGTVSIVSSITVSIPSITIN